MARILLADDTEFHLHLTREVLTRAGHVVLTAPDGLQALDLILREIPDLIVSDVVMPIMDGWELCEMVRTHPQTTALPFLFLTSLAEPPHRVRGLAMGADAFLTKPVDPSTLLATVAGALQKASEARQAALQMGFGQGLGLRDLLVIFRAFRKTGTVTATAPGLARGKVYFQEGEALHASCGRLQGAAALDQMLAWPETVLFVEPLPPTPPARTLLAPLETWLGAGSVGLTAKASGSP